MGRGFAFAFACAWSAACMAQSQPPEQAPAPMPGGQTPAVQAPAPPPPGAQQGLTPPIQPKTSIPQTPANVEIPGPPNSQSANPPLTADEAAQIALRNQPSIGIAHGQFLQARGQYITQAAALYPQLTLNQSYSRSETLKGGGGSIPGGGSSGGSTGGGGTGTGGTGTGTGGGNGSGTSSSGTSFGKSSGWSGGASISQLIFDFNHTRDLVRQFRAQSDSAKYTYTKSQIDAVLLVKNAFYTYVQDEGLVDVQQANVNSAQASLDLAQASLNAGLGAPADVINARTTLGNDIQSLLEARQTATAARITLCLDMGIDPRTPIVAANSTEPNESDSDVNTLVAQALKVRPDILAAVETLRAAGYEVSAAHTSSAPTINLQLSYGNNGYRDPLANDNLSASLSANWVIEDGGATAGRIETANGDVEVAKQTLQQVTLTAIQDVSSAWLAVKTSEQRVVVAASQVENATQNVALAQGQYKAGVTPFVTVITAQAALVQARSDQLTAVANLAQARATLAHALGH